MINTSRTGNHPTACVPYNMCHDESDRDGEPRSNRQEMPVCGFIPATFSLSVSLHVKRTQRTEMVQ